MPPSSTILPSGPSGERPDGVRFAACAAWERGRPLVDHRPSARAVCVPFGPGVCWVDRPGALRLVVRVPHGGAWRVPGAPDVVFHSGSVPSGGLIEYADAVADASSPDGAERPVAASPPRFVDDDVCMHAARLLLEIERDPENWDVHAGPSSRDALTAMLVDRVGRGP